MIKFKSLSSSKLTILLLVFVSCVLAFSSCKDDDGPSSNPLVGTWFFYYDGYIDNSDSFTFNADGTFVYTYDYERETGKYSYDENNNRLNLMYNDPEWGTEINYIRFINKDEIDIEYYGTYIRR